MTMSNALIIGTRGSQLALAQAEAIAAALRHHHPSCTVELRIISTKGDQVLDVALSAVGDKGLFVKEIEVALLQREVHLAVHSGKDLPSLTPDGLVLAAFPPREDPRDALVLPQGSGASATTVAPDSPLDALPQGARIGTSSLRRSSQLRALRPDLQLFDVRGNVNTRLRKLDSGEYDALILAAAGLNRLGFQERISACFPDTMLLPAVAQAAIAVEARTDDPATLRLLAALDDEETRIAVLAERAFLRRLEGGCQVPIAAHAQVIHRDGQQQVYLRGLVSSLDGTRIVRGERSASATEAEHLGHELAETLLEEGAGVILAAIQGLSAPHTVAFITHPLEEPPLAGWRVVVTRAEEQADTLITQLRGLGAEPVIYPTIAIVPPDDIAPLDAALQRLTGGGYDWLVLTSVNGVKAVQARLATLHGNGNGPPADDTRLLADAPFKLAVVGPATAAACSELLGIQPALMPEQFVAEALADALGDISGQRVLIATADIARPVLQERLQQAGAQVERVTAYRTVPASGGADLPAMLQRGEIHAITFTSGSAARYFVERVGSTALEHARQTVIACIGPVTARDAKAVGLPATVVARASTTEGLLDALVEWRHKKGEHA
jgi:hydroxymethylbilane synthase